MENDMKAIHEKVQAESKFIDSVLEEAQKVIVGQKSMLERLLIALLADGHVLLEGVPGLAKTLSIKTLSDIIKTGFQRIQFTPDLLPADIVGTLIYDPSKGTFSPKKGPIFSNMILADEINRAPAKVQSALLESMQERQVTIGNETYKLDEPFMVMATQNPIEQEGTYPLPEAQVDRFMLKVVMGYPDKDEELLIMDRMAGEKPPLPDAVIAPEDILKAREAVRSIYIDPKIKQYIVDIVFATREPAAYGMKDLKDLIAFGGSPRATISLNLAAKAHAFLRHRGYVTPEDVKAVGADVLRHRVIVTYEAEAEEVTSENIIRQIFDSVVIP
jgi:MoxR-like ATPase